MGPHIKGVDLSHWQKGFNFVKGVADGIVFMMTKASEGLGLDSTCAALVSEAKKAGIKYTGIYHFFHANISVSQQVAEFMRQWNAVKTEMGPILDLEETSINGHSYSQVKELALEWLEQVLTASGRIPMLYIDENVLHLTAISSDERFKKFPLWIAKYSSAEPPQMWEFWQYTDKGEQGADTDWFNGSESDLAKFLGIA